MAEFLAAAEVLPPSVGGRVDLPVVNDDWSRHGRLRGVFPRLYALSTNLGVSVRRAWHDACIPALPEALADQQVAELLSLHELLADRRLLEAAHDAWVWGNPRFTT